MKSAGPSADQLREEITRTLSQYCRENHYRQAQLRALSQTGFALHPLGRCRAGAIVLGAYGAIADPTAPIARLGAAGVELLMEAAYLFDRVADGEVGDSSGMAPAEELSVAIGLMTCGYAAASEAALQTDDLAHAFAALQRLYGECVQAATGQYLDAYWERRNPDTANALKMTELKAGSLGRLSAEFGASLATSDRHVVELLGSYGSNALTYAQLMDDLRDAMPENPSRSDWTHCKKTVPLVFFQSTSCEGSASTPANPASYGQVKEAFERSGADLFCRIVAEVVLNRAKMDLDRLKAHGVHDVSVLHRVLESLVEEAPVYAA